jgi:hypothetical protein
MAVGDKTIDKYEPLHFGIPKKAIDSWNALCEGQDTHMSWPCKNNPYFYVDYDGYGLEDEDHDYWQKSGLSEDDCESLCTDCPLLKLCYDFAVASDQEHGVWGGIDFGAEARRKNSKLF